MERKLKFDPLTTALIILLVIVVVAYCLSKAPFESVSKKISELQAKIDRDLSLLKIARKTQKDLQAKAERLFKYLSVGVVLLFILINIGLVSLGISFLEALEGTTLIVTITGSICSIIVFNKISVNALLEMAQKKVMIWVYQKNGFNPDIVDRLKERINSTNAQLENLKNPAEPEIIIR